MSQIAKHQVVTEGVSRSPRAASVTGGSHVGPVEVSADLGRQYALLTVLSEVDGTVRAADLNDVTDAVGLGPVWVDGEVRGQIRVDGLELVDQLANGGLV